ncbi:LacI family transcriptional regulator [Luteibacter sp. Sphag1AF]|uniref:LacI family DNA-binding transcriptional regulator n=1 Tax=Luteibacter sp. Sphag1AF TaxID=2587031 RepID=UPI00161CDDE8|nr:LacI family DNA-binding transcriptional regulator [Luteibacter sp. Sphag1AF]MBB3226473.1 LacI family transcriptional regulator [Luteibacter sp. Sphag1AF]
MSKSKTRIADVAAAAGVSMATVDRVLNARGGVSESVHVRVLEAARRLKIDRVLHATPGRWLRVAVLMQAPTIHFYAELAESFEALELSLEAQHVRCGMSFYPSLEPAVVAAALREASTHADALITVAYQHPLVNEAIADIAARMPVVTLASDIPDSGRLAYVGSDNLAAGRVAGELMGRFIGREPGTVLVITGSRGFLGHAEREDGFRQTIAGFAGIEVLPTAMSHEDPLSTVTVVEAALNARADLRGIYNISVGDEGVAATLSRHTGVRPFFIGHDLTRSNTDLLARRAMDVVLEQNPGAQAAEAMQHVLASFGRAARPVTRPYPVSVVLHANLPQISRSCGEG